MTAAPVALTCPLCGGEPSFARCEDVPAGMEWSASCKCCEHGVLDHDCSICASTRDGCVEAWNEWATAVQNEGE